MGSVGSPPIWVPYDNNIDCSPGICSSYCPQWCYIMFPTPSPQEDSNSSLSPLVIIAIVGILTSLFLLASCYFHISEYHRRSMDSIRREHHDVSEEFDENHEAWEDSVGGLDEALIESITVCKYKKEGGLVEETGCSVCLNEFQEDERIRLLPKCSHAFHLTCIDTWLRGHFNCPLCRANIAIAVLFHESPPEDAPSPERQQENGVQVDEEDSERGDGEEDSQGRYAVPKTLLRASSDLGQLEGRDTVIEIRDEGAQQIRRSISMDYSCLSHSSIADILGMNQDDDSEV